MYQTLQFKIEMGGERVGRERVGRKKKNANQAIGVPGEYVFGGG
jgi:hypothetical protein